MNRRKALISLVSLGALGIGSYFYLNNESMKRLEPRNNRIPADLHVHLSKDANRREIINLLGQPGLVGLARSTAQEIYLNYHRVRDYGVFKEIDKDILGIIEFKGAFGVGSRGYVLNVQEVMAHHHISALGCKHPISEKDPREAVKEIHRQKGIAIINHPFVVPSSRLFPPSEIGYRFINDEERETIEDLALEVDEVETFNGQCIGLIPLLIDKRMANDLAKDYADYFKLRGFKGIATSDTHEVFDQVLTSGIYIPEEDLTFKKLKEYIETKNFYPVGNPISRTSFLKGHSKYIKSLFS